MTDTITLPRATVQQALGALEKTMHAWGGTCAWHRDVKLSITALRNVLEQQAEPVQEPFEDLATELFVVAQRSPADEGFSDTIDRIESWLREHFSTQPQRKELSAGEILNMMPSTIPAEYDGELMEFARAVEAKTKEGA